MWNCFISPGFGVASSVDDVVSDETGKTWKMKCATEKHTSPIHPHCNDPLKANSVHSIRMDRQVPLRSAELSVQIVCCISLRRLHTYPHSKRPCMFMDHSIRNSCISLGISIVARMCRQKKDMIYLNILSSTCGRPPEMLS